VWVGWNCKEKKKMLQKPSKKHKKDKKGPDCKGKVLVPKPDFRGVEPPTDKGRYRNEGAVKKEQNATLGVVDRPVDIGSKGGTQQTLEAAPKLF